MKVNSGAHTNANDAVFANFAITDRWFGDLTLFTCVQNSITFGISPHISQRMKHNTARTPVLLKYPIFQHTPLLHTHTGRTTTCLGWCRKGNRLNASDQLPLPKRRTLIFTGISGVHDVIGKVNFFPCALTVHHTMKAYWGSASFTSHRWSNFHSEIGGSSTKVPF